MNLNVTFFRPEDEDKIYTIVDIPSKPMISILRATPTENHWDNILASLSVAHEYDLALPVGEQPTEPCIATYVIENFLTNWANTVLTPLQGSFCLDLSYNWIEREYSLVGYAVTKDGSTTDITDRVELRKELALLFGTDYWLKPYHQYLALMGAELHESLVSPPEAPRERLEDSLVPEYQKESSIRPVAIGDDSGVFISTRVVFTLLAIIVAFPTIVATIVTFFLTVVFNAG